MDIVRTGVREAPIGGQFPVKSVSTPVPCDNSQPPIGWAVMTADHGGILPNRLPEYLEDVDGNGLCLEIIQFLFNGFYVTELHST